MLEAVGHLARVRAGVDLERVRDLVAIERVVQLAGVGAEAILVADIDRDGAIAPQVADPLVDEGERRVGGELASTSACGAPSFVGRSR